MTSKFRFGPYEARWYPAVGQNAAGWRMFKADEFVFSAVTLEECVRFSGKSK